jgi:uncharacterized membrane protein
MAGQSLDERLGAVGLLEGLDKGPRLALELPQAFDQRSRAMKHRRHRVFYLAILAGAVVAVLTGWLFPGWAVTASAVAFFVSYLGFAAARLPALSAGYLKAHADEADAPMGVIFLVTVLIVGVCIVSLFLVVNSAQGHGAAQLSLSIVAVVLGWFVVHTMATYHYAYEFYERGHGGVVAGGLDFPGNSEPDGIAFLYFAYVIGMTAQVADVAITSNKMRRLVLIHSVFSFFFNTVIVAATVNVAVSIGAN